MMTRHVALYAVTLLGVVAMQGTAAHALSMGRMQREVQSGQSRWNPQRDEMERLPESAVCGQGDYSINTWSRTANEEDDSTEAHPGTNAWAGRGRKRSLPERRQS